MSFDEAARVHENVGPYLSPEIEIFYLNWVVVAIPFVLVLVFLGFNFIRNMDSTTRQLKLIAMAFYLGGALGLEMLSFYLAHNDLGHARLATLMKETFEMIGAALFGTAALHQIRLMHTTYTA
jgi:hypothetical protein